MHNCQQVTDTEMSVCLCYTIFFVPFSVESILSTNSFIQNCPQQGGFKWISAEQHLGKELIVSPLK